MLFVLIQMHDHKSLRMRENVVHLTIYTYYICQYIYCGLL